jgi:hypothetical protein
VAALTLLQDLLNNVELTEPCQVNIKEIKMTTRFKTIDLKGMMVELNIYESVFNSFITADLTLEDTKNVLVEEELLGTEPVSIIFETLGSKFPVDVKMILAKVKIKEPIQERSFKYVLSLVSPESLNDIRTKISESFTGNYSDIVKNIFENHLSSDRNLWLEETKNFNRLIIPNKSPVQAINMLASFSTSKKEGNASFLFFQTTKSYHFRSFADMIWYNNISPQEIEFNVQKEQLSPTSSSNSDKMLRAIEFKVETDVDVIRHTALGTYGSTLISHNIHAKAYDISTWNYHETFELESNTYISKIEEFPITPDGPIDEDKNNISSFYDSEINMISTSREKQYTSDPYKGTFQPLDYSGTVLQRKSELASSTMLRANLIISGMSGIQAGDIIEMNINQADSVSGIDDSKEQKQDIKLSGKWLVESVAHNITGLKYFCTLKISRDSTFEERTPFSDLNYPAKSVEIIIAEASGISNRQ